MGRNPQRAKRLRARRCFRAVAVTLTSLLTACSSIDPGCIAPDGSPAVPLSVVAIGWHTGITVPRELAERELPELADLPAAPLVEFGWGERDYYMSREEPTFLDTLRAALPPGRSVIQAVALERGWQHEFPEAVAVDLRITPAASKKLLDFVASSFDRTERNPAPALGPGHYHGSLFYPARDTFHALRNCNTWVARALEASGCGLGRPLPVTAGGLLSRAGRLVGR